MMFQKKKLNWGDLMAYAEKTTVSVAKTKADIEELIIRAGATQFVSGFKGNAAMIGFVLGNR